MPKPHVYHVDDQVRILRPRIIRRIGYPLHYKELKAEASRLITEDILRQLGFANPRFIHQDLIYGLAKALVRDRGFGGNERSIHYFEVIPDPEGQIKEHLDPFNYETEAVYDCTGKIASVHSKYVAKTGTRYGPCSWQDFEGGWDSDPGGLDPCYTHVILRTSYGDIETCDVEPYTP